MGLFRLIERGGSALGPASGALLLAAWGLGPALASLGLVVVGGSLTYGWRLRRINVSKSTDDPATAAAL